MRVASEPHRTERTGGINGDSRFDRWRLTLVIEESIADTTGG